MPTEPTERRPYVLGRAAPTVPVRDVEVALAFYVGVLGMVETFRNGQPTGFVIVERDAAEIHLALDPSHHVGGHNVLHLLVGGARPSTTTWCPTGWRWPGRSVSRTTGCGPS